MSNQNIDFYLNDSKHAVIAVNQVDLEKVQKLLFEQGISFSAVDPDEAMSRLDGWGDVWYNSSC